MWFRLDPVQKIDADAPVVRAVATRRDYAPDAKRSGGVAPQYSRPESRPAVDSRDDFR